jgi:hypothetical protein
VQYGSSDVIVVRKKKLPPNPSERGTLKAVGAEKRLGDQIKIWSKKGLDIWWLRNVLGKGIAPITDGNVIAIAEMTHL